MSNYRISIRLNETAGVPLRYSRLPEYNAGTHATVDELGRVAVGVIHDGYVSGFIIDSRAPTLDGNGIVAALIAEDAELTMRDYEYEHDPEVQKKVLEALFG